MKEKRIIKDYLKNRQLFFEQKETIILKFVNEFIALRFSFRKYMIKEKVLLLLRKREISNRKLSTNWITRFLKRHSEYRTKFSRHLDQKRHWSFDSIVSVQWFDLMRKTMIKYDIAIEDVYNINEKKYMMKMSEVTQWEIFSSHCSIFFALTRFFSYFSFIRRIIKLLLLSLKSYSI